MTLLHDIYNALGGAAVPLAVLVLTAGVALVNLVFRYTRADIGQYSFRITGGWQTFFIKNFNSVRYRSELRVHVEAEALEQVIVHGGPDCRCAPEQIANGVVRVTFAEVPADASFVIRAKADGKAIRLRIPPDSPLQSRSFDRPIVATTPLRRIARYAGRYLVGVTGMIGVFAFGVYWRGSELWGVDYALIGTAILLSVFSFWLVAPLEGKSIVAGYVGWGETGRSWYRDVSPEDVAEPRAFAADRELAVSPEQPQTGSAA
ncbi:MAG TPA: hypothetical protein VGD37_25720 [Kofleriaceae bacterium]|jgi:hypothetical protein